MSEELSPSLLHDKCFVPPSLVTDCIQLYMSSSRPLRYCARLTSVVSFVNCDWAMPLISGIFATASAIFWIFTRSTETSSLIALRYEASILAVSSVTDLMLLSMELEPFWDKSKPFAFSASNILDIFNSRWTFFLYPFCQIPNIIFIEFATLGFHLVVD